jgi:DNA-binding transcriptional ArsR family regulator
LKSLPYKIINEDILEKKVKILKAFANPLRLQIVNILMNGELYVGELAMSLKTEESLISQHLRILKSSGVLKSRRYRHLVYYSLQENGIKNIISSILKEIFKLGE